MPKIQSLQGFPLFSPQRDSTHIKTQGTEGLGIYIQGLAHFPDTCRYVLSTNSPDFDKHYQDLLECLDYLSKVDTKVFGEGDRNFGWRQIDL
jgi:hypothetical protein